MSGPSPRGSRTTALARIAPSRGRPPKRRRCPSPGARPNWLSTRPYLRAARWTRSRPVSVHRLAGGEPHITLVPHIAVVPRWTPGSRLTWTRTQPLGKTSTPSPNSVWATVPSGAASRRSWTGSKVTLRWPTHAAAVELRWTITSSMYTESPWARRDLVCSEEPGRSRQERISPGWSTRIAPSPDDMATTRAGNGC
jgi:hypothetical protein